MKRSTFAKAALVGVAGAMALAAAGGASAQSYGGYGGNGYGQGYDSCQRDANGRGIGGALVGAGIGATVGSQMAARGHRTDGSVLGGVLGALVGAGVGNSSAACRSTGYAPQSTYYNGGYNGYAQRGYAQPYAYGQRGYSQPYAYAQPQYGAGYYADQGSRYGSRYDNGYSDDAWAYGRRGERYRMAQGNVGPDGCALAESPIYMPDGRTQTRFVRVCRDSSGRFAVVD